MAPVRAGKPATTLRRSVAPSADFPYRRNVAPVLGRVSERLAQHKDVLAQIRLLHKGVRPHAFHQFILAHSLAAVTNKDQQGFKDFRSDSDRLVFTQ